MERTSVKFPFPNGRGQQLAGVIDMPATQKPLFYGVFGPCFTCVKESHGATKICREMAERGAAMLRFDTTGIGESGGDAFNANFTTRIEDIQAACRALAQAYEPPRLLAGHSMSGTAALSAARDLPDIKLVATIGSPADTQGTISKYREIGILAESADKVEINVLGRITPFAPSFIGDMLSQRVAQDTAEIGRPLLVFHAPHDNIVDFGNAETIVARSGGRGELIRLDEAATHLFEKRQDDAAFIARVLMARMEDLA